MTTNSNIRPGIQKNIPSKSTFYSLRSPGYFATWPLLGVIMFLLGGILFSGLAYGVKTNAALIQWDMAAAKALNADVTKIPPSLVEYVLFGFFLGKEFSIAIGAILSIYFLYKRFWRELSMVLVGLGGGALLWYWLNRYFDRPRPVTQLKVLSLTDPSFPSGLALTAVLCYGFLAYLLISQTPSRFWKWFITILSILAIVFVGFSGLFVG